MLPQEGKHQESLYRAQWLGELDYIQALQIQMQTLQEVRSGENSKLLFVEHPPVITLGRNAQPEHLLLSESELREKGIQVVSVDRGGDVTLHAPGQLVAYPIFDLAPWDHDVARYVRSLEEVVIRSLMSYEVKAHTKQGYPGVWVKDAKICAIGAKANSYTSAKGYIMSHGLALNLDVDLSYFSFIVPCGITHLGVTSLAKEGGVIPSRESLLQNLLSHFEEVFQIQFQGKLSLSNKPHVV